MAASEAKWTRNGHRRTALKLGYLSSTESVEAEEQLLLLDRLVTDDGESVAQYRARAMRHGQYLGLLAKTQWESSD